MYCPHCGNQIPDDSMFCGICGSKIEQDDSTVDLVALDAVGNIIVDASAPVKKQKKPFIMAISVIVVIAIIGIGALAIFRTGITGGLIRKDIPNYCVWLSDGRFQFVKNVTKENSDVIDIDNLSGFSSDEYDENYVMQHYAQLSPDGKYLYYFSSTYDYESTGTLYRAELGKLKPDYEKNDLYIDEVDSDICFSDLDIRDDGTIIYKKIDSSYDDTYRLYYYDGTDATSFAKGVSYVEYTDQAVFYNKMQDDNETYALYAKLIGSDDDAVKIASDVDVSFYVKDSENVFYTKTDYSDENYDSSIYTAGYSSESVQIAENVSDNTISTDLVESGAFFYTVREENNITYADYVENPHASSDISAVEPDAEADMYNEEVSNGWWDYTQNNDAYYAALEEYEKAQDRLELMEYLSDTAYIEYTYSMYYYDTSTKESVPICDQIANGAVSYQTSASGDVCAASYFKKAESVDAMSVDDIINDEDFSNWDYSTAESIIRNYVLNHSADISKMYFTVAGGKEQSLDTNVFDMGSEVSSVRFVLFNSGKNAAILGANYGSDENEDDYSSIYVAPVNGKAIGTFAAIDAPKVTYIGAINDDLCYYSDYDSYIYRNEKSILLLEGSSEEDPYLYATWYTDDMILFLDDYDYNYGGTLVQIDANGEKNKIADDVTSYCALDNGNILYTSNGNLKLYDGKESRIIANDVDGYWSLHQKEIDTIYDSGY